MEEKKVHIHSETDITSDEKSTGGHHLKGYPFVPIILFYIVFFLLLLLGKEMGLERSIFIALLLILLGNIFILVISQGLHKWLESSPHVFDSTQSVIIRSSAGLFELILYTLTITFGWFTFLAGFLIMKTLSVWKHESDPTLEGASTGILRIAVVLSLFVSVGISVYLINNHEFLDSDVYKFIRQITLEERRDTKTTQQDPQNQLPE